MQSHNHPSEMINDQLIRKAAIFRLSAGDWVSACDNMASKENIVIDHSLLVQNIINGNHVDKLSFCRVKKFFIPGTRLQQQSDMYGQLKLSGNFDWNYYRYDKNIEYDAAEILCSYFSDIVKFSSRDQYYTVRLTGGLDSTGILLSMLESVPSERIKAVTHRFPGNNCKADERCARDICKKYNVDLHIIDLSPQDVFLPIGKPVPPILDVRLGLVKFYEREKNYFRSLTESEPIIFDGHGGDQVFSEMIPPQLIKELFVKLRPLQALRKSLQYSRLNGISLSGIFKQEIRNHYHHKEMINRYFNGIIDTECHIKKNVTEERKSALLEAITDNSFSDFTELFSHLRFPFTTNEMIRAGLKLSVSDSFNATHKRLQYRNSIHKKFHVNIERTDKGHITGLYQIALRENRERIQQLISDGYFARGGFIKTKNILKDLERSAAGLGGINHILYKIIIAELIIWEYRLS